VLFLLLREPSDLLLQSLDVAFEFIVGMLEFFIFYLEKVIVTFVLLNLLVQVNDPALAAPKEFQLPIHVVHILLQ